ncbi:hypothetical protein [Sneathiella glossodoripedis]|uniref:hypothetical protein n=1 Tax=Sneathiella glossodoripedis TaxID=418853 RepID=UPI000471535B|nr:hypothetical protein [Sneathiella glossodoripedis]
MSKKITKFYSKNNVSYTKKGDTEVIVLPLPKHPINAILLAIYSILMLSMNLLFQSLFNAQLTNIQNIYHFMISSAVYMFLVVLAAFPLFLLYLILRPKHQERIHLTPMEISIDSGALALRPTVDINDFIEQVKNSPRRQFTVSANLVLRTLLIRYGRQSYLQVMDGSKYKNIARGPSNEVREFLFHHIVHYYEKVATDKKNQPSSNL